MSAKYYRIRQGAESKVVDVEKLKGLNLEPGVGLQTRKNLGE